MPEERSYLSIYTQYLVASTGDAAVGSGRLRSAWAAMAARGGTVGQGRAGKVGRPSAVGGTIAARCRACYGPHPSAGRPHQPRRPADASHPVMPPSTGRIAPVMYEARSLSSQAAASATSAGSAARRRGVRALSCSTMAGSRTARPGPARGRLHRRTRLPLRPGPATPLRPRHPEHGHPGIAHPSRRARSSTCPPRRRTRRRAAAGRGGGYVSRNRRDQASESCRVARLS